MVVKISISDMRIDLGSESRTRESRFVLELPREPRFCHRELPGHGCNRL